MSTLETRLADLDQMISQGKILETLEPFFAEGCRFVEVADGAMRESRVAQGEHLSGFFATLKGFNGATLLGSAVQGDTTFSEWRFDMQAGDGSQILWNEVLVRRGGDGMVVEEKYYNATA